MEDALVHPPQLEIGFSTACLNPCFNGRCTSTITAVLKTAVPRGVLILVLMEDALVQQNYSNA